MGPSAIEAVPELGGWVVGVVEGELPRAGVPAEHLVCGGLAGSVTAVATDHEELADFAGVILEAAGHGEAGQRATGGDEACLAGVFGEVVVEVAVGEGAMGSQVIAADLRPVVAVQLDQVRQDRFVPFSYRREVDVHA